MGHKIFLLFIFCKIAAAGTWPSDFLVNSHLRSFTAPEVSRQFGVGANVVEIDFDITQIRSIDLQLSVDLLKSRPDKHLVLHLKRASIDQAPDVVAFLNDQHIVHSQLLFYSNDGSLNEFVQGKFPNIYVARSTQKQIMDCLSLGLTDNISFKANCIEADIWIYYSFLEAPLSRKNIVNLIEKIRRYEAAIPVPKTRIAIDRVSTPQAACDVMKNFKPIIDGVITEFFPSIGRFLLSPNDCP